jgi:hypothetical protein
VRTIIGVSALLALVSAHPISAAQPNRTPTDPLGVWRLAVQTTESSASSRVVSQRLVASAEPSLWTLDRERLVAVLAQAPHEDDAAAPRPVLTLPMPGGELERFRIDQSPIMAPELGARYTEIRTYSAQGLDDPHSTARLTLTPAGLRALVLTTDGSLMLEPVSRERGDTYVAYRTRDVAPPTAEEAAALVDVVDPASPAGQERSPFVAAVAGSWGTQHYTYRAAIAVTGEYGRACGGTVAGALACVTTVLNEVNAIYERDLSVRLQLVANEDQILFTDPATDPFNAADPVELADQGEGVIDSAIGSENYDVGQTFGIGSAGVSSFGVCDDSWGKARSAVRTGDPTGLHFRRLVAHELGHGFSAVHTFNAWSGGACGWPAQRMSGTAYEPGSGSTIMSYGGTCGDQNVVGERDDYFHTSSIENIQGWILNFAQPNGAGCQPTVTATGNTPPTVEAGSSWTIPWGTPFVLTGSGSDANGDPITYTWEEQDAGEPSPPNTDDGTRALFRSVRPSASPVRTIPMLDRLAAGNTCPWECLPTTNRTMTFALTARDTHNGSGAVNSDTTTITSTTSAGPFVVTSPTSDSWPAGSSQTVTWDVAGTTAAPVSCPNVKVSLSTDGGLTFPTVLLASTPNDGSAAVTLPASATNTARIRVDCATNIFFSVSQPNFKITTQMSIADVAVTEGNSGTTNATFGVSLSVPSASPITVHYATAAGTATAAKDYTSKSGNLTFAPGVTSQTFSVPVLGDTLYEPNETFLVNLSSVTGGAILADSQATGTILNDDAVPSLVINDVTLTEGNSGSKNAVFTVTLSAASGGSTTVNYATADGTATVASGDYTSASGTLTFLAGTTTRTLNVTVKGDTLAETDETFFVNLSGAVGATLADPQGLVTIQNDDIAGTFAFSTPVYNVSEAAPSALITVRRTGGTASGVSVSYTTRDGTATAASGDYTTTSGTLTFNSGVTALTFKVPIGRATTYEPPETVMLQLTGVSGVGAALGTPNTAVLTITDAQLVPTVQLSSATYAAKEGAADPVVVVKRVGSTADQVTVAYTTANGTALAGSDYTTTAGTLTFAPGETTKTVTVPILNDSTYEPAEKLTFTLGSALPVDKVKLGTLTSATINIADDDPAIEFSAPTFVAAEASGQATITLKRLGPTTATITATYTTSDGTATLADSDYTATSGTVTFAPGVVSRTLVVPLTADAKAEGSETVNLTLTATNPAAALGTLRNATLTITDASAPLVVFGAPQLTAAEGALKSVVTVRRTSGTGTTLVSYATSNGTATAGSDYTATSGTLTFNPGVVTQTFTVPIINDKEDEPAETVNLTLARVDTPLGTPSAIVLTITDDDTAGKVQFSSPVLSVSETAGTATLTVTRTGGTSGNATVSYATSNGTATAGADYTATNGTLTFGVGELSKTFTVPILNDATSEVGEWLTLTLSNPSYGLTLGTTPTATLWIVSEE